MDDQFGSQAPAVAPPAQAPALSYGDVMTAHEMAKSRDPFFAGMDIPAFSRYMNQATGTKMYSAGDTGRFGGLVKQTETGLEQNLQPVTDAFRRGGEGLGGLIGPKTAQWAGEAAAPLPRMAATIAPLALAGEVTGPLALGATALGLGSQAAETYTKTGSPAAAVVSAASLPLMGLAGDYAAQAAARKLSIPLIAKVGETLGPGLTSLLARGGEEAARTVGEAAAMETASQLQSKVSGAGFYNPLTLQHAADMVGSLLPFKALDVPKFLKGGSMGEDMLTSATVRAAMATHNANLTDNLAAVKAAQTTAQRSDPGNNPPVEVPAVPAKVAPVAGKHMAEQFEFPFEGQTRAQFVPKDVSGGFGTTAAENLNETVEKPFGVKPTPTPEGPKLPGNTMLDKMKAVLPKEEWSIFQSQGIEDFLKNKRVSQAELSQWVSDNGPRVVVKKLGEGGQTPFDVANRKLGDAQHLLDTLGEDNFIKDERGYVQPRTIPGVEPLNSWYDAANKFNAAKDEVGRHQAIGATSGGDQANWSHMTSVANPKDYVELQVVVPKTGKPEMGGGLRTRDQLAQRVREGGAVGEPDLFPGNFHAGGTPNVLGWVRGHMITDEKGVKTFHIEEVQSDWAARQKEVEKVHRNYPAYRQAFDEVQRDPTPENRARLRELDQEQFSSFEKGKVNDHPLLKDWERLVLKAAVQHAIGEGATRIAVSDGETAMMMESHDRVESLNKTFKSPKEAQQAVITLRKAGFKGSLDINGNYDDPKLVEAWHTGPKDRELAMQYGFGPSQEGGMRLHYDSTYSLHDKTGSQLSPNRFPTAEDAHSFAKNRTAGLGLKPGDYEVQQGRLPSLLKELTGYPGEKVGFGEHKMSMERGPTYNEAHTGLDLQPGQSRPRKDLIFKNPDGTPKTSVTATSYPLDKAYRELQERRGYGLFTRDKLVDHLNRLSKMDVEPEQIARAASMLKSLPIKPGETLADAVWRHLGLDPRLNETGSPQQIFESARAFAGLSAKLNGYTPQEAEFFAGHMMRIVSRFAPSIPRTRIVEGDENFAMSPRGKNWNAFIAIAPKAWQGTLKNMFGQLWATGHELGHQIEYSVAGKDPSVPDWAKSAYVDALNASKSMTPEDKVAAVETLMRGLTGDKGFAEKVARFRGDFYKDPVEGNAEFVADVIGLTVMGAGHRNGERTISDSIFFGNKETTGLMRSIIKTLANVYQYAKDFVGKLTGNLEPQLQGLLEATNRILATKDKADESLAHFLSWEYRFKMQPDSEPPVVSYHQLMQWHDRYSGFVDAVAATGFKFSSMKVPDDKLRDDAEAITGRAPKERFGGARLNEYHKLIPQEQLAREIPQWKTIVDLARMSDSMVTNNLMRIAAPWTKNGKPDFELLRQVGKGGAAQAYSDIARKQNELQAVVSGKDREAIPSYSKLNPKERGRVDQALANSSQSHVMSAITRVESQRKKFGSAIGALLQSKAKGTLDWQQASSLGTAVFNMVHDPTDTQAAQVVSAARLDPNHYAAAHDMATDFSPVFKDFQKFMLGEDMQGKPWYHSEVRPGDYHLSYTDATKTPHYESFQTEKEASGALARIRQMEANGEVTGVRHVRQQDVSAQYRGLDDQSLEAYRNADSKALDIALRRMSESDNPQWSAWEQDLRSLFSPGEGAAAEMMSPYMRERRLVAGRENLNMVQQALHYFNATAYGTAKSYFSDLTGLALHSPGVYENPNIYANAKKYLHDLMNPGGKELTSLKNLNFFMFQGYNPSSNLIVFLHQALRHAPELMRQGFGIGETYKGIGNAFLTVAKARINKSYDNPELGAAVSKAVNDRLIDKGINTELYNEEDLNRLNTRSIFGGNGTVSEGYHMIGNGAYRVVKMARDIYGLSTQFNGEAAFVSAYKLARSRQATPDEAYKFAGDTVRVSTLGGGRYNRPLELQGLGKMTGEGGLMYHMASYECGAIAQMSRYLREAVGMLPTDQRSGACKAAAAAVGTQLLLAGVLGLPFIEAGINIIDNIFHTQIKSHLRQAFFSLAGDDEKMGHVIADMAMRGVPDAGGLGIGTRLELGRLFGVDPETGKWDLNEEFLGPLGGLINSYTKATMMAGQGRWDQAGVYASPSGIRGLVKMYVDGGAVKNTQGSLLFQPTDSEKALQALGFKSTRLQDYYEEQEIKAQSEAATSIDLQNFHRELGARLLQGDYAGVRSALYQRQQQTGNYDVLAGSRAAIQSAQDQSTPTDPTRFGSRSNAQSLGAIGQMFEKPTEPTEVQRTIQRMQIGLKLQIPGAGMTSPVEFQQAALVDQIMRANPTLARPQALLMVERLTHPMQFVKEFGTQGFQQGGQLGQR